MNMNRIYAVVLRQFYLLRESVSRIVPLFVWFTIDIVLWGFLTKYLGNIAAPGFSFVSVLLGAVLLWDFLIRVMQGVTMAFFEDVWARNFLNIFATPITLPEYLASLVLSSIITSMVVLAVMIIVANMAFGLPFFAYGLIIVPFLFVLFLFGIALGIFGSAIVMRLGPAAEWFIWPIPALISPFACVFYPLATLPHWMQVISYLLPPAYVFENLRAITRGGSVPANDLLIGGGIAVIYILAACWSFVRVYRHALRTGLIARYSAESLG